jgi:hypothetical protein
MKYMKKGLVPKYMGKITEVQWKEFIQQKADPKALAISNEYVEMLMKNIYPHHMGSKGYVAKIPEWKKKIEEVAKGIGRMTFLVELSTTLNTLDAFVASLLRCRGKLVFQMMLGATRSLIDTRETLKM